ncbi:TIGR03943 family putative permease subunit [Paenibacillus contaminans]|uniref:TIGR03943 family protein n=1 Tax=Paenibacillus contaminans TaxID=450362 RepID=A0A329MP28_9BACL|nr:TIGR03943 family protein [Paenibacillus contaminans]RAV21076.1 TIGR03943 family protein [Paenibacillus contaminans]
MKEHIRISLHYWLRAAIFLGFSLYILYLSKTGHLLYYIAPRMTVYVKLSAIVMYIIAVYMLYSAIRAMMKKTDVCDDCDHTPSRSPFKNLAAYTLFAIPLLLGFSTPDMAMNSALASKKGMILTGTVSQSAGFAQTGSTAETPSNQPQPAPKQSAESLAPAPSVSPGADAPLTKSNGDSGAPASEAELDELFKADKYTENFAKLAKKLYGLETIAVKEEGFIETLSAIDLFMKPFVGKKIELSGFVYREDDMQTNQFVVARFQLQCCSADAAPFGVMVEYDRAPSFATDAWVKLSGTLGTTNYGGNEIVVIKAAKIEKIAEPKNVYVYPNYDFLTAP